ncbi:MAG: hypothetical protein ACI8ZM_000328 [Crocinitomix sp.]|jgi:hypothetical protein
MNSFELAIKDDGHPGKSEYYLNLKIDGEEFLKKIDEDFNVVFFGALKKSVEQSGQYLIFTCSCGIADCGGWDYVKVIHQTGKITWDFSYGQEFHFEFPIDHYRGEIARIEIENRELTLEPLNVIEPE